MTFSHLFFFAFFFRVFLKSFFHEIHETDQKEINKKEAAFSDSLLLSQLTTISNLH